MFLVDKLDTLNFEAFTVMNTRLAETGTSDGEITGHDVQPFPLSPATGRKLLLISNDQRFHEKLCSLANTTGFLVAKAERAADMGAILHASKPDAVLLDLDLADEAGWEIADHLLGEPSCPAVLLFSGRTAQFNIETAIRAGSLVSKSESAERLLGIVQRTLGTPEANQAERNVMQRVLIRWLKPAAWAESATPTYRFWGLNE